MGSTRRSITLPRMNAHRLVIVATALTTVVAAALATALASLAGSPLQHGAAIIVVLALAAAGASGLFIVILGLAPGSAERELTLARLTVMGHQRGTGLVMAEAMPAVVAAVLADAACAVALPRLIGSSIDLSRVHRHSDPGAVPAGRARARPARGRHRGPRPGRDDRPGQGAAPAGGRWGAQGTLGGRGTRRAG
jgi:hypothetical protein